MSVASVLGQTPITRTTRQQGRSRPAAALIAGVVLLASVSGCADDDCEPIALCDIRDRTCQEDIGHAMACMRGGNARLPPVEVISEEEFRTRTQREPSDEDALATARWRRGLSLFRLSEATVDPQALGIQLSRNVAGAYLPEEDRIVVIDRGVPVRSEEAVVTLAHEMVHAMQFAEHDFEALYGAPDATFDSRLALQGLIEGEATHYTILARVQLARVLPADVDWQAFYNDWQQETLFQAESDAQPLDLAYQRFPYAFGGMFATEVWLARGAEGLRAMFDHPPRTTRELLFGPATVDVEAERQALDDQGAPVLPERFERVGFSHLGAWIGRMFTARMGVPIDGRFAGPQALAADVFSVYRNTQTEQVVATWRVRLLPWSGQGVWPLSSPLISGATDPNRRDVYLVAQVGGSDLDALSLTWEDLAIDEPPPTAPATMNDAPRNVGLSVLACAAPAGPLDRYLARTPAPEVEAP